MTCAVFLSFSNNDITKAIANVREGDIVLTDLFCPDHCGKTVEAIFKDASDTTLVSEVSSWFNTKSVHNKFSYGYVNVFYQSCIRPLAGFLHAIDKIVAINGKENVVFHLPVSLNLKRATSTYFLAEYESAGIHLHDRHSVFLPYIEDYLAQNKISYVAGTKKIALQHLVYNPIRLWGVFFGRLAVDVGASFKNRFTHRNRFKSSYDKIIIIRTVGQAITMMPYLSLTQERICLVIGSSFTDSGSFSILNKLVVRRDNISIIRACNLGVRETLFSYLNTVAKVFRCEKAIFPYKGLKINLSQALREIIVMNAGLDIYRKQLLDSVEELSSTFIFSLEQKSPHAFVDAELAKSKNTTSAQIQTCQQAFFDIPNPVPADFFLCETPKVRDSFQDSLTRHTKKMRYIGSFQGVGAKRNLLACKKNSHILKVCLFLGMGRSSNNSLLQDFSEFAQSNNIEITVKLHPRDRHRYSSVFSQATYVNSYKEDFSEFSKAFDLAVTFPSGIISDLLYSELPFLVYVPPHKEYQGAEAEYLPDGMETVVCFSSLSKKIKNIDKLAREHAFILENFRKANGIITNIKSIELNLDDLIIEKRLMHEDELLRKDSL